jgi:acyl-CoA synthetase (AMP-forming)/AMP-acid ligase II
MEGVEVRVNDEHCVIVRSRAVGTGYWPEPDAALAGGVFRTGDLGEVRNGGVYLRGRSSDRINVAGRKVNPEDVERALAEHPAVKDCLVFGVPADGIRNELIAACVVLASNTAPRELTEFLQVRLLSWQVPREWWVVESLEVNARGKRSRAEWRERYLGQRRTD